MKLWTMVTLLLPSEPHDQWHTFQARVRLRFGGPSSPQGGQHHALTSSSGGNTYFPRAPGPLNKGFKIQVSMLALFLGNWTPIVLGVILRRGPPHFGKRAFPGKQKEYFSWMLHLFSLSPTLMTQGLVRPRGWATFWKPADFPPRHWQATEHSPCVPVTKLWGWVTWSRLHTYQVAKPV